MLLCQEVGGVDRCGSGGGPPGRLTPVTSPTASVARTRLSAPAVAAPGTTAVHVHALARDQPGDAAPLTVPVEECQAVAVECVEELLPGNLLERAMAREARKVDAEDPGVSARTRALDVSGTAATRFHPPADRFVIDRRSCLCHWGS